MSTSLVEFYPATVYIWGQLLDTLDYPDGRHIELPAVRNKIQLTFGTLLANCVSGLSSIAMPGINRMEVGTGDPGWDTGGAPDPGTGQTALLYICGSLPLFLGGELARPGPDDPARPDGDLPGDRRGHHRRGRPAGRRPSDHPGPHPGGLLDAAIPGIGELALKMPANRGDEGTPLGLASAGPL